MYNEDIKQRFFEENPKRAPGSRGNRSWVFEKLSSYETAHNKDIAELDKSEAQEAFSTFGFDDFGSVDVILSFIRSYVKWAAKTSAFPEVSDGFLKLKSEEIDLTDSLRRVLFKDEADLLESIEQVFSLDDGFVCVPVLLLAWLGLSYQDILSLQDTGVDLTARRVCAEDGTVLADGFSDLIADALRRYRDCKVSQRENGLTYIEVIKDRSVPNFLKRMIPRGSKKFGTPYTKIQTDTDIYRLAIKYEALCHPRRHTFTNVWRSGRMHRLWEMERSGIDVTKRENRPLVESAMKNKKNYYNTLKLYEAYKRAFYEPKENETPPV